ncbi:hypothetical protein AG0111_0g8527 [Alternaria gaisen]|uniref:Uncharacterized protein n=1 Tax=Alternaria gaisen TaxID=167740 RepID=A0ACB6FH23_9PLEO|nr:hypothetical protein AG0111_0g8527 [Alternaria gaisen]
MNLEYDSEESFAAFNNPDLPSTLAYSTEFFGELVDYDIFSGKIGHKMFDTKDVVVWSLEGLGYTNDAPIVYADGRMNDQAHPPDYDAYSSPLADSWEEGLREIEDFDWSNGKEGEQKPGTSDSKVHDEEEYHSIASTLCPIGQDKNHNSFNGDAAYLHERTRLPNDRPEDRIFESKNLPPANKIAPVPEVTETVVSLPPAEHVGLDSRIGDGKHAAAQDYMEVDGVSIAAAARCGDISSKIEGGITAEQGKVMIPEPAAYGEKHLAGGIAAETKPCASLNDNDGVKASTVLYSPAFSYHGIQTAHGSDLEIPAQIAKASDVPKRDTPIIDAPEIGSEHATVSQATSSAPGEGYSTNSPESPEALSRREENVDGSRQTQLRDAADNISPFGLAKILPSGYRDRNVHFVKPSPEIISDEVSMRHSSQLAAPLPAQQSKENASLPPLLFASQHDALGDEGLGPITAETSVSKENTSVTQLAQRPSKLMSPSKVEPLHARAEDQVVIPDLERSKPAGWIPKNDLVEGNSYIEDQDKANDMDSSPPSILLSGSPTPTPAPEGRTFHLRKRSKSSNKTKNVSETDSDAPPKKKARRGTPVEPHPTAVKERSKALKELEFRTAPSFAKTRRGAVNSEKEITLMDEADEESQSMILDAATEMRCSDHEGNDADMEGHYSDVEVPVTLSKYVPPVEEVPSISKSRQNVSHRELQGLSSTQYRDRPSNAKRDMIPISRQLFKLDTLGKLRPRANAFEQSPAVHGNDHDSFVSVEGNGATISTLKMDKPPMAEPKATSELMEKQENSKALEIVIMEGPDARPARRQKDEPMEHDEEEEGLFPASKIDTAKPASLPELTMPPRGLFTNARRVTRTRNVDQNGDVTPAAEDNPVIDNSGSRDDDSSSGISEPGDVEDLPEEQNIHFEDAQGTIETPYKDDEADDDYSDTSVPVSKKPKLVRKSSMLGNQSLSRTNSRKDTPASSVASPNPAPATNKYGFKPSPKGPRAPRTRAGCKAAVSSAAPTPLVSKPVPAPKARVPPKRKARTSFSKTKADTKEHEEALSFVSDTTAKGKAKRSTSVATATSGPLNQPSVRKTRHASAMENQSKIARRDESKVVEDKTKAAGKARQGRKV